MTFSHVPVPEPPEIPDRADTEAAVTLATREFLLGNRLDMRALAATLGVGRTTLYRWVGDREALLAKVLADLAVPLLDQLWMGCPGQGTERIAAAVEGFMTANTGFGPMRRLIADEPTFALRVMMSHDNALFHGVHAWFAARLREEGVNRADPGTLATAIVSIIKAYSWARVVSEGKPDIPGARAAVMVLLGPHTEGERRRWDIASGAPVAPRVRRLVEHLERDGWVAEQPEAHLLPHLRRACERPGSPFRLHAQRLLDDGVFEIEVVPGGGGLDGVDVHRAVIRLLAEVAEPSFFVRQVDAVTYDCATGVLDGDPPGFAGHGHLIRLRLRMRAGEPPEA